MRLGGTRRAFKYLQLAIAGADVIGVALALVLAGLVSQFPAVGPIGNIFTVLGVSLMWMGTLGIRGAYEAGYLGAGVEEYRRAVAAGLIVVVTFCALSFAFKLDTPRSFVVLSFVFGVPFTVGIRWGYRTWLFVQRKNRKLRRRVWAIASDDQTCNLVSTIASDPNLEFQIVGVGQVPWDEERVETWLDFQLGQIAEADADMVALSANTASVPGLVQGLANRLEGSSIVLLLAQEFGDVVGTRLAIRPAAGIPFLVFEEPHLIGPRRVLKRVVDIIVGSIMIVLTSPLWAISAVAVRLSGPGPIIYRHQRVGRNGNLFTFPKFRTMVDGADQQRVAVIGRPDENIEERYRRDPRITKVGRVLRRWSLDELPQFVNVVGGSMSLVGPRPILPSEADLLAGVDHRRHLATPGLTGLWQINGRKETTWDDRILLDLQYVQEWSLLLDAVILVRTFKAIVWARGAF